MQNPFDFFSIVNDSKIPVVRITRGSARWDFPLDVLKEMSVKKEFGIGSKAEQAQALAIFLFSKVTKLSEFEDLLDPVNETAVGQFFIAFTGWLRNK
jgi:hypothetical protein